jgi:hypothetical protein
MFQNISATNNISTNNFSLTFTSPFYQSGQSTKSVLSSTAFQINNIDHYFGDVPIPASSNRTIIVYKIVAGNNVTVIPDAGLLEPTSGKLSLNSFAPTNATTIRLTVIPNSLDLAPKRDQLLSIENTRVTITPEIDTISVSGSSGSITYSTTPRLK